MNQEQERIDIKQIDLPEEKVVSSKALYIILRNDSFEYFGNFISNVPVDIDDLTQGWKQVPNYFRFKIKREKFVSLEITYSNKIELYRVEMEAEGYPNPVKFFFQNMREAQILYDKLDKYIFK